MARLLWVTVVYLVHISLAMSKSSSPIRTRLRENITGYRSRYSLHRGQVQTNVPKSQNVKDIEKRDEDPITRAINQHEDVKRLEEKNEDEINWNNYIPPVLMMALNQQDPVKNGLEVNDVKTIQQREVDIKGFDRITKAINQQDQAWNKFEEDVKRLEERNEDEINWNNYIPPVLMMALNQQDPVKNGLEVNDVKTIQQREVDIKGFDRITKAINQQDQAWNKFEEDVKRLEERNEDEINWNNYIPPVLMMALNQQDPVKNGLEVNDVKTIQQREVDIKGFDRITKAINQQDQAWNKFEEDVKRLEERNEDEINWNNYIPPVLMMALNQQDEKKSRYQLTNKRMTSQSNNIDFSKYQAILMMALNEEAEESSLLQEDSNQDMNEKEVDTNDYRTIMMSVKPNPQGREKTDIKESDATTKSLSFLLSWLGRVRALRTAVSDDEELYFNDWVKSMDSLKDCSNKGTVGRNQALAAMGLSDFFLDIFWPFRHDVNLMNQRLAVSGFEIQEYKAGDGQSTKTNFIKGVENMLGIHLPVKENQVILSFDDEKVVEELVRTGILNISDSFKSEGKHIFQDSDKQQILKTANEALKLINETSPDLYKSIVQMVAVIAFYRDETSHFTGGTGPSLVGIIWLNPVNLQEWTVPFMAEQIVHEFTHNSLFSAELVHGMYRDGADLSTAQPISAIRHEQRDFDRCLHAAYVSASLITFHTRIGQFKRAHQLAETLTDAVLDLNSVNAKADVLDASGRGMLQFLNGYMCLMRL